jgi:hypothetical protein
MGPARAPDGPAIHRTGNFDARAALGLPCDDCARLSLTGTLDSKSWPEAMQVTG